MDMIYLDHNATTPVLPEVVEAVASCLKQGYANPASGHRFGQRARRLLEDVRESVAEILGARLAAPQRDRLIFTSGGTEANNLALLGMAAGGDEPGQIIISAGEHQSVIGPAEHLLERGWRLDTLGLTPEGVVRIDPLPGLLQVPGGSKRPGMAKSIVSVILGNHETGVLQPVVELAAMCREARAWMHTDAAQVVGKLPVDFRKLGVAAMSIAAHKFGGPPGIGALVVRDDVPLAPMMFGGHQQSGLRPGTEPVALAVGMATALEIAHRRQEESARRMTAIRDRFEQSLSSAMPEIIVHGRQVPRLPQTTSAAFPGLDGETLRTALDLAGVACSIGAACASGSAELSPTLRAMDLSKERVASSLRFSLGATTTEAEIDEAVRRIAQVCRDLRSHVPSNS